MKEFRLNNKGIIYKILIYMLAIAGVLFLYKSFTTKNISGDFSYMLQACQQILNKTHLSETDRKKVEESFSTIHNISKNNGILTNGYK